MENIGYGLGVTPYVRRGKKQSKSEVWCKAKRNTYLKRCEELKTHRLGWALTEDPNWKEKVVEVGDLSIHGAKTATPSLGFFSAPLSALYISLPVVLKTRRKLAGKVSIHSRPAKVTLSAI